MDFNRLQFWFWCYASSNAFGSISGNHLNPAVTLAQATAGVFPWAQVTPYIISQVLGAICGQLLIITIYWPYIKKSTDSNIVFACFATSDCVNSKWNGFISELVGTGVLMFVAIGLYKGMFFKQAVDIANIGVGFLITALVMALGGPTGPALNPARDFGPRLVYSILPIPNKKDAHWSYGWVPVVAPILGAIIGIFLYKIPFGL